MSERRDMRGLARDRGRQGASLVKLILLVLAAPVATYLVVTAVILLCQPLFAPPPVVPEIRGQPRQGPSWTERLEKSSRKAPPNEPRKKTPATGVEVEKKPAAPSAIVDAGTEKPGSPPAETRKPEPVAPTSPPPPLIVQATPPAPPEKATLKAETPVKPEPPPKPKPPSPKTGAAGFSPEESVWLIDDFQRGDAGPWSVKAWANTADLSVIDGELLVELGPGKQDKSAIGCQVKLDLSSRKKMVLDVRNETNKRVGIALALMAGDSSTYFESETLPANPGENKDMAFDLSAARFKCAASSWQHNSKLTAPEAVKSICILIYGENKGRVCLDNVRAISPEGQ